jgi:restriction system protein
MGWGSIPDLSQFKDRTALEATYRRTYPDAKGGRVANHVGQLYAFVHTARPGDLVVVPLKTRAAIAIGEITGDYAYRTDLGPDMTNTRPVHWLRTDIPRNQFDQDLLYTFGSAMTFSRAERNRAEERVRHIANAPPVVVPSRLPTALPQETESAEIQDVEQHSRDQVLEYIGRKFRGHELARLVEAILKAQGSITKRSDPGPDGGVDILAASGSMGFDSPRMCVQVKSSDSPADVNVFRSLKGTMDSFGAEQGILVAWRGFKDTAVREAHASFFRVRLWDAGDLLNAIFSNYDRLPEEIQAELPLKRIWALALPETED